MHHISTGYPYRKKRRLESGVVERTELHGFLRTDAIGKKGLRLVCYQVVLLWLVDYRLSGCLLNRCYSPGIVRLRVYGGTSPGKMEKNTAESL